MIPLIVAGNAFFACFLWSSFGDVKNLQSTGTQGILEIVKSSHGGTKSKSSYYPAVINGIRVTIYYDPYFRNRLWPGDRFEIIYSDEALKNHAGSGDHTFDDYKMSQPGEPAWRLFIGNFDKFAWWGVILNVILLGNFVFRRIFKSRLRVQAGL